MLNSRFPFKTKNNRQICRLEIEGKNETESLLVEERQRLNKIRSTIANFVCIGRKSGDHMHICDGILCGA